MLLLNYEDACERVELERKKYDEKVDLSVLVEKRQLVSEKYPRLHFVLFLLPYDSTVTFLRIFFNVQGL